MTILRPYQQQAIDSLLDYWYAGGNNGLIDMATGTGKSVVISEIAKTVAEADRRARILVLVHVQELVEQNFRALMRNWPQADAGIYSAGLGLKQAHHRVTFASIQSVYKKATILGERSLVLIDEAHLVPSKGGGMYRELLTRLSDFDPKMRIGGFSATPYRLDQGLLHRGEGAIFDDVVFSYGIGAAIKDGFLTPLISRRGDVEIDVSDVAKRGGEFVAGALEAAANVDRITASATREIVELGRDRRSWLVFCTGIKHAYAVRDSFRALGIHTETVTGEMDEADRRRVIEGFRAGQIRCLTNANVLTTGFDAPAVDLVAMLRPTLSTGLYVQIVGRGARLAEGKQNCLVLDYAGNCRRHGPVDAIVIKPKVSKSDKSEDDEAPPVAVKIDSVRAKECPNCKAFVGLLAATCEHCDHVFPAPPPKHEARADTSTPILSSERANIIDELPVLSWSAKRHDKAGSKPTMRVTYFAGVQGISEWIAIEHSGYAGEKAERWWRQHGGDRLPQSVDEAVAALNQGQLRRPEILRVRQRQDDPRYKEIVGRKFEAVRA